MIPPRGFKAELYPLRHQFLYAGGLNGVTGTLNSTMVSIVRSSGDSAMNNPDTINTNPHHPSFKVETGPLVHQMSIIEKIKMQMQFTLTEDALADGMKSATVKYMPIFMSFPEKMASTDEETGATAASILEVVSDATNEDVTPLYNTVDMPVSAGNSDLQMPMSTVNDTEVFGDLNLTVNLLVEGVAWNNKQFFEALRFFTNKGAISSMVGKQRSIHLTDTHPTQRIFINKFPPRAVRRIVPHSAFFMLLHMPLDSKSDQAFYSGALTSAKSHIGYKLNVTFNEWNADHLQEMM